MFTLSYFYWNQNQALSFVLLCPWLVDIVMTFLQNARSLDKNSIYSDLTYIVWHACIHFNDTFYLFILILLGKYKCGKNVSTGLDLLRNVNHISCKYDFMYVTHTQKVVSVCRTFCRVLNRFRYSENFHSNQTYICILYVSGHCVT